MISISVGHLAKRQWHGGRSLRIVKKKVGSSLDFCIYIPKTEQTIMCGVRTEARKMVDIISTGWHHTRHKKRTALSSGPRKRLASVTTRRLFACHSNRVQGTDAMTNILIGVSPTAVIAFLSSPSPAGSIRRTGTPRAPPAQQKGPRCRQTFAGRFALSPYNVAERTHAIRARKDNGAHGECQGKKRKRWPPHGATKRTALPTRLAALPGGGLSYGDHKCLLAKLD